MDKKEFVEAYLFSVLNGDNWHRPEHIITAAEKAWNRLNPGEKPKAKEIELSSPESIINAMRGRRFSKEDSDKIVLTAQLCTLPPIS